MSLIQDALKRQQKEFGNGDGSDDNSDKTAETSLNALKLQNTESSDKKTDGSGSPPPSAPERIQEQEHEGEKPKSDQMSVKTQTNPGPEQLSASEEHAVKEPEPVSKKSPKSKVWLVITGIAVFLAVVVAAFVYLTSVTLSWVKKKQGKHIVALASASKQSKDISRTVQEHPPVKTESKPAAVSIPKQPPVETVKPSKPKPIPLQVSAETPKPAKPEPHKFPLPKAATVSEDILTESAKPGLTEKEHSQTRQEPEPLTPKESDSSPKSNVEEEPPSMDWPILKLTAVLSGLGSNQDVARINNTMVPLGSEIEGVTLMKVNDEGVVLKYGHETQFLRMGASTY